MIRACVLYVEKRSHLSVPFFHFNFPLKSPIFLQLVENIVSFSLSLFHLPLLYMCAVLEVVFQKGHQGRALQSKFKLGSSHRWSKFNDCETLWQQFAQRAVLWNHRQSSNQVFYMTVKSKYKYIRRLWRYLHFIHPLDACAAARYDNKFADLICDGTERRIILSKQR